jgi:pyruvate-ferredoxin/flavodoxin oxidoreductase
VYVCATAPAFHGHFLRATAEMLAFNAGASLMVANTPCDTENGLPEDQANARSRLAVETRMAPLFIHDPRRGESVTDRFDLDGNPEVDKLWTTGTLVYTDAQGQVQLMERELTPADFAVGEGRFAKQFRWLAVYEEDGATPIAEYVELDARERVGKVPFVYTTDRAGQLARMACSPAIVALVEDRKQHWQTLQFLAGETGAKLTAEHQAELDSWIGRHSQAVDAREAALDSIAAAMADLATASKAPTGTLQLGLGLAPSTPPAAPPVVAEDAPPPIFLDPSDEPKCNDCATCYQELPQLFEKTTIVVDGVPQTVARMRPKSWIGLAITPELKATITRVKASCDAEIIQ